MAWRAASNSSFVGAYRVGAPDMPCGALLKRDGGTCHSSSTIIGSQTAHSYGAAKLPENARCERCPRSAISASQAVADMLAARIMSAVKSGPWRVSSTGAGSGRGGKGTDPEAAVGSTA